ncbi:hypothetical protein Q6A51_00720 [Pseudomonas sp. KFB-139]|uniref:Uncharacterized protein n=1 Tax=Pseudomonas serbiensis TaxID=3064350 RepID=A0ABT9CN99_9PSED|nr:hypothetical protein [Pseudomonas sp. KFB-138]MDO7925282.1 hypothetical protein [Pseudomonas sp. KFB-138]
MMEDTCAVYSRRHVLKGVVLAGTCAPLNILADDEKRMPDIYRLNKGGDVLSGRIKHFFGRWVPQGVVTGEYGLPTVNLKINVVDSAFSPVEGGDLIVLQADSYLREKSRPLVSTRVKTRPDGSADINVSFPILSDRIIASTASRFSSGFDVFVLRDGHVFGTRLLASNACCGIAHTAMNSAVPRLQAVTVIDKYFSDFQHGNLAIRPVNLEWVNGSANAAFTVVLQG